jgi:hypothetical protein
MIYRGHITNGTISLDQAIPLKEGAAVNVEFVEPNDPSAACSDELRSVLLKHVGKGRELPTDLAAQHDHYAHGKPKS